MSSRPNELFANNIQTLVANNELDSAIIELSKLAKNSEWTREIIMQSAKLKDVETNIINGTLSFDNASTHKSQIRVAILNISKKIFKSNDSSLKNDISLVTSWDKQEEIVSVLESMYEVINSILIKNEEILSPIFTSSFDDINLLHDKMTLLFHNQKNRGNFRRWIIYLSKHLKENKIPSEKREYIENSIHLLDEFYRIFYEQVPANINIENLSDTIDSLKEEYPEYSKEYPMTKAIVARFFSQKNKAIGDLQRLADLYLKDLREAVESFAENIEWIK